MCWSSEVALCFGLAETAVLLYVFARDSYFDRINVIFHVPLVVQELLQALLWPHVGSSGDACDAANRGLSLAVTAVVCGVPLYCALLAKASQSSLQKVHDTNDVRRLASGMCRKGHRLEPFETEVLHYYCSVCGKEELPLNTRLLGCRQCDFDSCEPCVEAAGKAQHNRRLPSWDQLLLGKQPSLWAHRMPTQLRQSTRKMVFFTAWMLPLAILCMHRRIYGHWETQEESLFAGPRCTTRGPNGHQVWPMNVWPRWWLKVLTAAAYFILGGGFVLIPKPSYMPFALNVLAFGATALYVWAGDEWGSVWCWLASCLCVLYLVEPMLFQRFRVFDPEVLGSALSDGRRRRAGFWAARMHFLPAMTPWAVLLEHAESEALRAGSTPAGAQVAVQRAARGFGPTADISIAELARACELQEAPSDWKPGMRAAGA